ncbi:MAG: FAD-dependent oxidoreductase [Chlamydiota bacterium]|nr:FAD-dependent oxidoreductase [Chlamydiota bacterium]
MVYKIEIPDQNYWKKQIKCQDACPVHTDARGYVRAIAEGDFEKAYLIARAPNPLASICGRICAAPCEASCRRGSLDQSISIRALKRSAVEEGMKDIQSPEKLIERLTDIVHERLCSGWDDLGRLMEGISNGKITKDGFKSIGIIGSGPAGLAAAHDLALMGFSVTIYEMEPVPAGMLYLGVPAYRLPRGLIEAEVNFIQTLGVKILTNCAVGKDIAFSELKERHDAVIIAVGCKKSRTIPLPGSDAKGVIGGVEFLRDIALKLPHQIGEKIAVLGGGNVAYDVARTALRQQQMDIVGSALRDHKGVKVTLCCIEKKEEMLASEIEIMEGEEEGVERLNGYGPQEILVENGKVMGVLFYKVISIFDAQGRFNPRYDKNDQVILDADTVIFAIGQRVDLSFLDPKRDDLQPNARGFLDCDSETLQTSVKGVYVAGDLAHGPKLMIDAIASGKRAARSIYQNLAGRTIKQEDLEIHFPIENYQREMGYERLPRRWLSAALTHERIRGTDVIVEKGFRPEEARIEGSRCLDCGVNTIFDGNRCVLCGGCADVCPELCLKLVSLDDLEGGHDFSTLISIQKERKQSAVLSAIIKDEEKCIRCGLCAQRCPADAITMERFTFKEFYA